MKTTVLRMEGITELSQEELVSIVGGDDAYRAGQLVGYAIGFMVGGAFTVFSRLVK